MSSIKVKWQTANTVKDGYHSCQRELSDIIASVREVRSNRCMRGGNFAAIYGALDRVISDMEREKMNLNNLQNGLGEILRVYEDYENRIAGQIKGGVLEEVNVIGPPAGDVMDGASTASKDPFALGWNEIWKAIGKAGMVGSSVAAIGNIYTGGWSTKSAIGTGKNIAEIVGSVAGVLAKGGTKAEWGKALVGWNNAFDKLDITSAGSIFKSSLKKQFYDDLSFKNVTGAAKTVKTAAKWAKHALTFVTNVVDNYDEHGKVTDRMVAETVIETAVDIGVDAMATAAVSAVIGGSLIAAGLPVFASAVVVGTAAVGVTWAANSVCKWITGDDIAEAASTLILDKVVPAVGDIAKTTMKAVGNGVKAVSDVVNGGVQAVSNAVGNGVQTVKDGWNNITKWGKGILAFT